MCFRTKTWRVEFKSAAGPGPWNRVVEAKGLKTRDDLLLVIATAFPGGFTTANLPFKIPKSGITRVDISRGQRQLLYFVSWEPQS